MGDLSKLYVVYTTVSIIQAWHLEDCTLLNLGPVGVSRNDVESFFKKVKRVSRGTVDSGMERRNFSRSERTAGQDGRIACNYTRCVETTQTLTRKRIYVNNILF